MRGLAGRTFLNRPAAFDGSPHPGQICMRKSSLFNTPLKAKNLCQAGRWLILREGLSKDDNMRCRAFTVLYHFRSVIPTLAKGDQGRLSASIPRHTRQVVIGHRFSEEVKSKK
jgi:hypothetical protein